MGTSFNFIFILNNVFHDLLSLQMDSAQRGESGRLELRSSTASYKRPQTLAHVKTCLASYRSVMGR